LVILYLLFSIPNNIKYFYSFQQLDLLSGFLGQTKQSNALDSPLANIPDFVKIFNEFSPETLEFLCIEPLINLIPNDPILNYIFGVARLFELVNTFMSIITSTNRIRCLQNPNSDYAEISQFLRLNKTVGLVKSF